MNIENFYTIKTDSVSVGICILCHMKLVILDMAGNIKLSKRHQLLEDLYIHSRGVCYCEIKATQFRHHST